jgi:general secretion pathway protein B
MSYILDALKRADAERERGAVPGLHSRQVTSPAPQAASDARSRLWLAGAAVLVLGGLSAGLWAWRSAADGARVAAVVPAPLAQPVLTPAPLPASAPAAPQPPAVASLPPTAAPAAPSPVPEPALAAPAAGTKPSPKRKPDPIAKAAEPAPAAPATAPLLSELPEDIRRQIPTLTITGAVYSEDPARRMLLVNGQVLAQGSLAAPELNLEEIRARSSVFSFRGTRFRVAH